LDKMTLLRYNKSLSVAISGQLQNPLIRSNQLWKGENYESPRWHPTLQWTKSESKLKEVEKDGTWHININVSTVSQLGDSIDTNTVILYNTRSKRQIHTLSDLRKNIVWVSRMVAAL
jgi:hypothetical protein